MRRNAEWVGEVGIVRVGRNAGGEPGTDLGPAGRRADAGQQLFDIGDDGQLFGVRIDVGNRAGNVFVLDVERQVGEDEGLVLAGGAAVDDAVDDDLLLPLRRQDGDDDVVLVEVVNGDLDGPPLAVDDCLTSAPLGQIEVIA